MSFRISKVAFTAEQAQAKDARTMQLDRQRNQAATERQNNADKAASQRLKEQYGPGGYAAQAAEVATKAAGAAAGVKNIHEVQLEEMRQKGATARETMKITEADDPFEFKITKASSTIDPVTGQIVNTPAQNQVTDKTTNVTYSQVGLAFVPEGWAPPGDAKINSGQKLVAWLLKSPNKEKARENSLTFLRSFGYLPAEYFSKFSGRGPVKKVTERGTVSATTPTNPVVQ